MGNRKEKKGKHEDFFVFPADSNVRKDPEDKIVICKEIVYEILAGSAKGVDISDFAVERWHNHIIALYKNNLRNQKKNGNSNQREVFQYFLFFPYEMNQKVAK